jgi:hypothetical protein
LVGGSAILTFGQWATKALHFFPDDSGHGTFTVTAIQGKTNKIVSFIAAYIAVNKGSIIGIDSLYAQQTTLHSLPRFANTMATTVASCHYIDVRCQSGIARLPCLP